MKIIDDVLLDFSKSFECCFNPIRPLNSVEIKEIFSNIHNEIILQYIMDAFDCIIKSYDTQYVNLRLEYRFYEIMPLLNNEELKAVIIFKAIFTSVLHENDFDFFESVCRRESSDTVILKIMNNLDRFLELDMDTVEYRMRK